MFVTCFLLAGRGENCSAGGVTQRPIFPTPPPLLGRRDGRGGSGGGGGCRAGGGGVNPTSMAQNDTHVALIILTTQMWGGGGGIIGGKNLFGPKFCVPAPSAPTSILTQNKGPDTEPHFSNPPPPPPFGGRPCHPPPPPPAEQFSGRPVGVFFFLKVLFCSVFLHNTPYTMRGTGITCCHHPEAPPSPPHPGTSPPAPHAARPGTNSDKWSWSCGCRSAPSPTPPTALRRPAAPPRPPWPRTSSPPPGPARISGGTPGPRAPEGTGSRHVRHPPFVTSPEGGRRMPCWGRGLLCTSTRYRHSTSEAAPEGVREAVGGGCQSGWGRLLSVTNAIEAGTWRQGNSGWA